MKRHSTIFLILTMMVAIAGCQASPAATTEPDVVLQPTQTPYDLAALLADFQAAGATVTPTGSFQSHLFPVPGQSVRLNEEEISVFEFADPDDLDTVQITPDGGEIAAPDPADPNSRMVAHPEWVGPPHFFRRGRLLVQYVGDNLETLQLLQQIVGPQIAGATHVVKISMGEHTLGGPASFEEAVSLADVVVLADVLAAEPGPEYLPEREGPGIPTQHVTLQVVKAYKGDLIPGDSFPAFVALSHDALGLPAVTPDSKVETPYAPEEQYLLALTRFELAVEVLAWQPGTWPEGTQVPLLNGRQLIHAAGKPTNAALLAQLEAQIEAALQAALPMVIVEGGPAEIPPLPVGMPLTWKRSPLWTGARDDLQDAGGRPWYALDYDDSAWTAVTLPEQATSDIFFDLYYRAYFEWDGQSPVTAHFVSDDGLAIYINGRQLGQWGFGWREEGCVNVPYCARNAMADPVVIPTALLQPGTNLIAVDLWNAFCCDYLLNVSLV